VDELIKKINVTNLHLIPIFGLRVGQLKVTALKRCKKVVLVLLMYLHLKNMPPLVPYFYKITFIAF